MASADWTVAEDSLDENTVRRAATTAIVPPSGGGDFVFAFNSLLPAEGASALFHNADNFAPYTRGASIRACLQKGAGGGATGYTPLLFLNLQGESVNDDAYVLGYTDGEPHKIALWKGALSGGIPTTVLRQSDESFLLGVWHHLRLDATYNDNGDVILRVYRNDLAAHPLGGAPVWTEIPGLTEIVDDPTGITTGSLPLVGGRGGFGLYTEEVTRRGYVAHVELLRQLDP